jgi:hypothetical protein
MALPQAPVMFLSQGYQRRDQLAPVGVSRLAVGGMPLALLLNWGQVHDEGVQNDAVNSTALSPVLASPGAQTYGRTTIGRHKAAASWIQRSAPRTVADWDLTMDEAFAAQQALGLPGTITPSRHLGPADWPDGVQDSLDAVRRAFARYPGQDIFVGLIVDECWILDPALRRTLLNQFTDLPPDLGAAIHVLWSSSDVPNQPAALRAMRTVVVALAQDDRRVLLLEAGLLGWLAVAWGAWGFSAGLSQASWRRSTQQVRRARGQPASRVARYFESDLLHHVRQATHLRLVHEPGYRACLCGFCAQLNPSTTGPWDHSLAEQHALHSLATLAERVVAPRLSDRHARVRAIVDAALEFERSATARLTADSRPLHLPVWRAEL